MLDNDLKKQLADYLTHVSQPVELVAHLDEREDSSRLLALLEDIASLSAQVSVTRRDDAAARTPSFRIERVGSDVSVEFAAIPMGHEFTSLVLALLQVGGHPPKVSPETLEQVRNLSGEMRFETFVSLGCQNCPDVVQALNLMAVVNPGIQHVTIDGALFQDEAAARQVMSVPAVFLNGEPFAHGRMGLSEILAQLDTGGGERDAVALSEREPYDMLIVGGGPAGAAAAVYAARKGIRTGLVAERFGGQLLDTLAIENYISVTETDGPRLAADLESHVNSYDVDVMTGHRAVRLHAAEQAGGMIGIELANGATLEARSVVLATGARWRQVGVPGEDTYRNKGVAYCPHCDGPLYKNKRVCVIGGGNSGVEAAIDLAGIAQHVTLLEFADSLKADAVLVQRLRALPNVTVHTDAETTEITGDGHRVNGVSYTDRASGTHHQIDLEGVFVQIGLVPNTEWLNGTVALSRFGEIEADARGATNVDGVFAAGDATTTPYKQIIVAAGGGSSAALGAFDYLIRSPQAAAKAA